MCVYIYFHSFKYGQKKIKNYILERMEYIFNIFEISLK
jgi:hypothetical protein